MTLFYLACFDVVDDRTRNRVVKILKEYGERVQKSVFECAGLDEERFLKLKNRVEDCIDNAEDTVRYYAICQGCLKKVEYSGVGDPPQDRSYRVL
jgi:CRISPR-associated protein Cas2